MKIIIYTTFLLFTPIVQHYLWQLTSEDCY